MYTYTYIGINIYSLCVCMCLCVSICVHVLTHAYICESQRTTQRNQFFPFTMWKESLNSGGRFIGKCLYLSTEPSGLPSHGFQLLFCVCTPPFPCHLVFAFWTWYTLWCFACPTWFSWTLLSLLLSFLLVYSWPSLWLVREAPITPTSVT